MRRFSLVVLACFWMAWLGTLGRGVQAAPPDGWGDTLFVEFPYTPYRSGKSLGRLIFLANFTSGAGVGSWCGS